MNIQQIARWAVLVPLFIIPFLALYIASDLFFPFIAGKNFAFRILIEIALAGYVLLALADRRYRPQFSWLLVSFLLLVLWMIVADALAVNPLKAFWSNYERMDGWVTLVHVFALFVIAGHVLSVDRLWRNWWMTFISASALVTLHGAIQWLCIGDACGAQGKFFAVHQSSTRLDATLGNSEYLAGFLLLAIGITVWQAFASKTKMLRMGLFALAALQVLVLFGTGTRGTFVAILGAALVGGLLWLYEMGAKGRKGAAIFIAAVLVFIGGFYAIRNSAFIQESPNLSRFADISLASLETRFTVWGMAFEGFKDRPLTGWGHEGFNHVFNTYYDPSMYGQEPWFDRAHNVYLDWLLAGGIPALLLFLLLGGSAVLAVYRARELAAWERVLLLSVFAGYAIQGLVVFDNLFTYVPLALLLAYAHTLRMRPIAAFENVKEIRGNTLDVVAAPVALVAALFVIYSVNIPTYAAGRDLIKGMTPRTGAEVRLEHFKSALAREPFTTQEIREQLLSFAQQTATSNESNEVKTLVGQFAVTEMQKEIERTPTDARLHSLLASFLRNVNAFDEARVVAAKAREFSPTKQGIILEQGIIEWQAGKPAAALAFFQEARALQPEHEDLVYYEAAGHIIAGDTPGGKQVLTDRFGTTTVNSVVVAAAYQQMNAWGEVVRILELRRSILNDAATGYQLAIAYARAGRIAEARALVRSVIAEHPDTASQGTTLLTQLGG